MDRGRETADFGGVTLDGRYRLGDRRADGSHEAVYLPTGRRVIVHQAPGGTAEAMRLKRTLQRVVGFDHPAVVPVLDAGAGETGLYLVESRVEGEPLSALMGQAQPPDRVADILRQLTRVLAEAHGRGLFHGGLRPECILLQQTTGRADYVRLAGVGLAETPFAYGTSPWAAPEQRDAAPVEARTDLYALGVIGRALLGGLSPTEAAHRPLPGVPLPLLEVLDGLCRRSPGQRPPSAVAVLGPIERAVSIGLTPSGRPMSDTMVSTGPLPRMDGPPPPSARPAIDAPLEPPPARPTPWPWIAAVAALAIVVVFLLLRDGAPATTAPPPADPLTAAVQPAAQPAAAAPDAAVPDAAAPDAAPAPVDAAAPDAKPDAARPLRPRKTTTPAARPPAERPVRPRPRRPVRPRDARPVERPAPADEPADYEKL